MEVKLTNDQIVKLIGLYTSHSLLWDMSNNSYRRNDLEVKTLDAIAVDMALPAQVVKKNTCPSKHIHSTKKSKEVSVGYPIGTKFLSLHIMYNIRGTIK